MKLCPFCAESIQDQAVKCRYCFSMLEPAVTPVTAIRRWKNGKVEVLVSNGSPRAFWDLIVAAAQNVQLPVLERSAENLTVTLESKGATWRGFAGERIFATVTEVDGGSHATFVAKTNPAGAFRVSTAAPAAKWVNMLLAGIGVSITSRFRATSPTAQSADDEALHSVRGRHTASCTVTAASLCTRGRKTLEKRSQR